MSTFNTRALADGRILVTGVDDNGDQRSTKLWAIEWNQLKQRTQVDAATEQFDAAVKEFFAPLTKAAEQAKQVKAPAVDPAFVIVLSEAVEGVEAKSEDVIYLSHDTVVLRLIEQGDTSRLIWDKSGGVDTIEILAIEDEGEPAAASVDITSVIGEALSSVGIEG